MLAAFLLFAAQVTAADALAADAEGIAVFESEVRPILAEHCHKCHSHSADKIKGGLVLDSRDGALHGGDSGPAIVPGAPDKSLLIEAIAYSNEDLQMPPKGKKLTGRQIAILTEWVRRGAPWPASKTATATRARGVITEEDRNWWAFRSVGRVEPPRTHGEEWVRNEIDQFIIHRLKAEGLRPAERATRTTLLRRVFFNVIGLPPSPEEIAAFVADRSPDAFEKVVDRLLASPHYGERWARHWLDLVRYAESDGFRIDDYRPHAWRYRDYVIRAFNEDKPYDRFIEEQIAGDEIAPLDPEARVATGFLRHWVYEYNNRDVVGQWNNILNDITDVTADVFLALGVQCARCHDHKFDPILQKDYFRLQAFFAPILPRDDLTLAVPEEEREYQAKLRIWEEKTAELRRQIAEIEEPHKAKAAEGAIIKFPPETQALIRKPLHERTPWEHQIAELAYRQVTYEYDRLLNKMKGADKDRLVMLYKQLAAFDKEKPAAPAQVICVTDVGRVAPPVRIPKRKEEEIAPGYLTLLDEKPALIRSSFAQSTGRRAELARWLTDRENPLTARVMVNRIWQYHFGRGLVGTSSDFGTLGEKPSHPELLDWLARRFVEGGWSMKKLHRLILLSATYQQGADNPQRDLARLKDPENRWCWRGSTRRLEAEQIRDAILSATGELELTAGGPSADHATARRTIYTKSIRNVRDPLLDVFDAPEGFASSAQRNVTTTPTQSLLMMNGAWSLQRARAFAGRLAKGSSLDDERLLTDAYQLALGRPPSREEIDRTRGFLETQAEVIGARKAEAKPAPFQSDKMPFRDGRAAVFTPGGAQERLTTAENGSLPRGDFTAEAFIVLRSLYETGDVRTIVSHWDGKRGHPGWSFGVTSKQSRYKPQTLVLLLSGDQPWNERDPVEPIFSGLHIELGKPYFVAVTVDLDEPGETGVTFYAKDLSNDDEPMQVAQLAHKVTSGIQSAVPLTIGARSADGSHFFDGLIDDVRISTGALAVEQLLLSNERVGERTAGWWKFENDPGVYEDSSGRGHGIVARAMEGTREEPRLAALVDFCHVLLNSNEFIYLD